jgi:hypothetical protein
MPKGSSPGVAIVVAYLFGEPQLQHAIDLEDSAGAALVSRGVQRSIGLLTGTVMGAALGGSSRSPSHGRTGVSGRSAPGSSRRCSAPVRS